MKKLFIFAAGVVAGAVAGAYAVKERCMQQAEEEIQSVKQMYKEKIKNMQEPKQENKIEEQSEEVEEIEKEEYKEIIDNSGYVNYGNYMNKEDNNVVNNSTNDLPYIIEPEEFGEDGYDTSTITFYADGVLIDEVDDIVDDPDTLLGLDNLRVFEEFGASSVYIRNDIWKMDFEVLKDDWCYSDLGQVPSQETINEFNQQKKEKKPHEL